MQVLNLHDLHDASFLANRFATAIRLVVLVHHFLLVQPNVCLIDVLKMLLESTILLRVSM